MGIFFKLVMTGQKRRKREMWYVSLAAFIAILFMSSVSLFQIIMDRYLMETNYQNYGDWVISAVKDYGDSSVMFSSIEHPYLSACGVCTSGPALLGAENEPANVYIGTMDETAKKLGNITLYEGRFPETEQEIAMDLSSLSALGYSYETGQTVRIAVLVDGEVSEQEFLLTGTVASFAKNWKHIFQYPLPSCIVTEEGLSRIGAPSYATYFYQLDRSYESLDMEEFTQALFIKGHARVYNSYVYENRIWGSKEMFGSVQLLITCIGALAMGYLMLSYVSQRRKWYYRLRCAGADKVQIRLIVLAETACGAVPYAVLGIAVPYALGAAVCGGISAGLSIPYFFRFHPSVFFSQMGAALGMVLFSVLCAWVFCGDKNLSKNSSGITKQQIKRLHRDAKWHRNVGRIFLRRQRKLHPLQQTAFTLFSFSVCLIFVLCLNKMYEAGRTYAFDTEGVHDFSADKSTQIAAWSPFKDGAMSCHDLHYDMYYGFSKPVADEIRSLIGIQDVWFQAMDETHILTWPGKGQSPIEQYAMEKYEQNKISIPNTVFTYYESCDAILDDLSREFNLQGLNREAFLNGEEIILLLIAYEYTEMDGTKDTVRETTISAGDTVEIVSAESRSSIPVELEGHDSLPGRTPVNVGVVIKDPPMKWRACGQTYRNYRIIASKALAERVAKADGKQMYYNCLELDLGKASSFEATQKRLVDIFRDQQMQYSSQTEDIAMARHTYIQSLCMYGILSGIILFLFLLIQIHFHRLQDEYRKREYGLLKQLGMEEGFFGRIAFKESFWENGWMLFSVPCGYAVMAAEIYRGFVRQKETAGLNMWSEQLQEYVSDPVIHTTEKMQAITNPAAILTAVILLIIGLALIRYWLIRRAVKQA